ncbi:MAG TPA: helix-turn-helix domain-containing protein [Candidatus Xenobia bacterium]|nr:helix-turn-helix domain-containing protein [Candidatus Xenobia bacterium]
MIAPPSKLPPKDEERPKSAQFERARALLAQQEKRELISAVAAAKLLGKSPDTIYRWLHEGQLAGRRVGGRWLVYRDTVQKEWQAGVVGEED